MTYLILRSKLIDLNRTLKSPLLNETIDALASHPTTVSEEQLAEAKRAGAAEVLAWVGRAEITRQKGHPEEEERTIDNVDLGRMADRMGVSRRVVWPHG